MGEEGRVYDENVWCDLRVKVSRCNGRKRRTAKSVDGTRLVQFGEKSARNVVSHQHVLSEMNSGRKTFPFYSGRRAPRCATAGPLVRISESQPAMTHESTARIKRSISDVKCYAIYVSFLPSIEFSLRLG